VLVALLIAITSSGIGFYSKYRVVIQGWVDDMSTFISALYIHGGCEFPDRGAARVLSKYPMVAPDQRLMAARLLLNGAAWSDISSLVAGRRW
jgi:hypothetical protein